MYWSFSLWMRRVHCLKIPYMGTTYNSTYKLDHTVLLNLYVVSVIIPKNAGENSQRKIMQTIKNDSTSYKRRK